MSVSGWASALEPLLPLEKWTEPSIQITRWCDEIESSWARAAPRAKVRKVGATGW